MKLYIAVHDEVPDYMVPTMVAHSVIGAHLEFHENMPIYDEWLFKSFKKCVLRVNESEFNKIAAIDYCYLGHENTIQNGRKLCAIPLPTFNELLPNVLRFAKLWKPKENNINNES